MRAADKAKRGETSWALRPLNDELGEALRAELSGWPGIRLRPLMGTLAYFRSRTFLGCYVNRELLKTKPDWVNRPDEPAFVCIRLRAEDAARALGRPGVQKSRLAFVGWVEVSLASRKLYEEAVRWFARAYEHPPRATKKRKPRK